MVDEQAHSYPHGVPCWVDTEQSDPQTASRFYGGLFGWEFTEAMPAATPDTYLIATLRGHDVAAIGHSDHPPAWTTYVSVTDADDTAAVVTAAGGTVIREPQDAGPGGRTASCADPLGAVIRLWQPRRRPGAQLVNAPQTWNFSHLHTRDLSAVRPFYAAVFGWEFDEVPGGGGASIRVPGYG